MNDTQGWPGCWSRHLPLDGSPGSVGQYGPPGKSDSDTVGTHEYFDHAVSKAVTRALLIRSEDCQFE